MDGSPQLSVVVPLLDEEGNVEELAREISQVLADRWRWELILVDDGSTDRTPVIAARLSRGDPRVRLVRLSRRYGQATAMQAGFDHARGELIVTMDGDRQNDPADIPRLLDTLGGGYDVVVGYRVRRKDKLLLRKVPSWVANRLIRWITGVPVRDNGCSLKAYRRATVDQLRLYSDMHRFIPALAVGMAGAHLTEVPVNHRARVAGSSKYGLSRMFRVLADLATVKMIRSFREKPLHLFVLLAGWSTAVGVIWAGATVLAVATFQARKAAAYVFPGAALLWFALSGFLVLLGLVAERVLHGDPPAQRRAVVTELDR